MFAKFDELKKPLSLELELVLDNVLLYFDSCSGNTRIFPNAGGADNQPPLFWQMIDIIERGLRDYERFVNVIE